MIPKYDINGNLPPGFHKPTFDEFEKRFVDEFPYSKTREEIMNEYKVLCEEISSTKIAEKMWVNGSYITNKEDPDDIDLLIEVDGLELDRKNLKKNMDKIIYDAPLRTNLRCSSVYVARYPESNPERHESYIETKVKILGLLFNSDEEYNLKGIIEFDMKMLGGL